MRKLSLSRLLLAVYIELWRFYSNKFDRIGKQAEWERYFENKEKEKKKLTSRMFREPDSLKDGLHLKFIWKKMKKSYFYNTIQYLP